MKTHGENVFGVAGENYGKITGVVGENHDTITINISGDDVKMIITRQEGLDAGPAVECAKPVAEFQKIKSGSQFDISWTPGPASAKVIAPQAIQDIVSIKELDGELCASLSRPSSLAAPIKLELSSPTLSAIDLSGSSSLRCGEAEHSDLRVSLAGSAKMKFLGSAKKLVADLGGSSALTGCFAGDARVRLGGSSTAELDGFGKLLADAAGSSRLVLGKGMLSEARLDASGCAEILNAKIFSGRAAASGCAKIHYGYASERAIESVSGLGSIARGRLSAAMTAEMEAYKAAFVAPTPEAQPPVGQTQVQNAPELCAQKKAALEIAALEESIEKMRDKLNHMKNNLPEANFKTRGSSLG